ncbi:regulatory protein ArsR [Spirochaeta thermophila DSM 6578]|uniref:Regulatory protein ArsR n=2 Tax=Winmispira thermophila TaxID=154 RepID=G0GE96_WINT7|nr:regulatory protein ArsR [Spirochaeta thermophila DSM 6578]
MKYLVNFSNMDTLKRELDERVASRYKEKAAILKALAHPTRLWMLEQLARESRCVCEFVAALDVDFSTVSKHLALLKSAGLVEDTKEGRQVRYRLVAPQVAGILALVEDLLQQRAKVLEASSS